MGVNGSRKAGAVGGKVGSLEMGSGETWRRLGLGIREKGTILTVALS